MFVELIQFDQWLFEQIMLWCNPAWLTQAAEFWVKPEKYFVIFLFLLLYSVWKSPRETLFFLAALLILLVINEQITDQLKHLIARPRPGVAMGIYQQASALSFPSAHSSNTMAAAVFFLLYRKRRGLSVKVAWWAVGYSLLVGIGRVIANYHYPFDVICGWLLGARMADIMWFYFENYVMLKLFSPHTAALKTPLRFF